MLGYIKQELHGLRHICEKDSVATRVKKEGISLVILAALPAAVETMSGYYLPGMLRPETNTLYDDFVRYVQITRSTVTYIRQVQGCN